MPDDQKNNPPLSDFERRSLVASPHDMLRDQRERLRAELNTTAERLEHARQEVTRLEERDRLLRAALADIDAALDRLHLKPVRFTDGPKPQPNSQKPLLRREARQ
jgi:chromosome segregation ATPase